MQKGALGPTLYRMDFSGKNLKSNMDHYVSAQNLPTKKNIFVCTGFLQISKFSLQILHENHHRTACGILKLDLTFVTTVNYQTSQMIHEIYLFSLNQKTKLSIIDCRRPDHLSRNSHSIRCRQPCTNITATRQCNKTASQIKQKSVKQANRA